MKHLEEACDLGHTHWERKSGWCPTTPLICILFPSALSMSVCVCVAHSLCLSSPSVSSQLIQRCVSSPDLCSYQTGCNTDRLILPTIIHLVIIFIITRYLTAIFSYHFFFLTLTAWFCLTAAGGKLLINFRARFRGKACRIWILKKNPQKTNQPMWF